MCTTIKRVAKGLTVGLAFRNPKKAAFGVVGSSLIGGKRKKRDVAAAEPTARGVGAERARGSLIR